MKSSTSRHQLDLDVGGASTTADRQRLPSEPRLDRRRALGGLDRIRRHQSESCASARLNGDTGTAGSRSSAARTFNHDPTQNAWDRSIADVGGVPYVAWAEPVPNTNEALIRVSRLNADGTAWVEVMGGSQPDQPGSLRPAGGLSPHRDGVPYVAWQEGYGDPKIPRHTERPGPTEIGTAPRRSITIPQVRFEPEPTRRSAACHGSRG